MEEWYIACVSVDQDTFRIHVSYSWYWKSLSDSDK